MIGVTVAPGATGVSSGGAEVRKPELLSAPAGKAATATTATAAAAAANSFLVISLPLGLLGGGV
jgi:hypothetical protein